MKHKPDCQCPIHIEEDTTAVKWVAISVVVFFLSIFVLTARATESNHTLDSLLFVDSNDDPEITYIIINDGECKIKMKKKDIKNQDLIVDRVDKECKWSSYYYY